jgi:hypothetical protein
MIQFAPLIERQPLPIGDIGLYSRLIIAQYPEQFLTNDVGRRLQGFEPREVLARMELEIHEIGEQHAGGFGRIDAVAAQDPLEAAIEAAPLLDGGNAGQQRPQPIIESRRPVSTAFSATRVLACATWASTAGGSRVRLAPRFAAHSHKSRRPPAAGA